MVFKKSIKQSMTGQKRSKTYINIITMYVQNKKNLFFVKKNPTESNTYFLVSSIRKIKNVVFLDDCN